MCSDTDSEEEPPKMAGEFSITEEALLLKLAVVYDTIETLFLTFHKNELLLSTWGIQFFLTFSKLANISYVIKFSAWSN